MPNSARIQGKLSSVLPTTIHKLEYAENLSRVVDPHKIPVSVIVPARNEAHNLDRCLRSLQEFGEVYVIDSGSTDATVEIAASHNAHVAQFRYQGGWPKKRQWAMDSLPLACDWILLVDADEAMTPELSAEIKQAIRRDDVIGFYIDLQMHFLGRRLRHCGANFEKLSLFRRGKARFECRVRDQDSSMCDMEVHEHLIAEGKTAKLKNPLIHNNVESLFRYIQKHNEYSNWEAKVWASQAQPRTATVDSGLASSETSMASKETLSYPRVVVHVFSLQVCVSPRISGWSSGPDLLRISRNSILPHQIENLRAASKTVDNKGLKITCAA